MENVEEQEDLLSMLRMDSINYQNFELFRNHYLKVFTNNMNNNMNNNKNKNMNNNMNNKNMNDNNIYNT